MKIDWHAGIILLFALSSLFFLGKALENRKSPIYWYEFCHCRVVTRSTSVYASQELQLDAMVYFNRLRLICFVWRSLCTK